MKARNKTMKTITTLIGGSLRRALCTLLLCVGALWAMPISALTQIYVSQLANPGVGEYNASTGAAINANLITELGFPDGLAVSGNNLFVAELSGNNNAGSVGEYNASTGAVINPNFIVFPPLSAIGNPSALAVSGNILYVAGASGTIGEYDATTGAPINARLITGPSNPSTIAVSGNMIFAVYPAFGTIGKYNATQPCDEAGVNRGSRSPGPPQFGPLSTPRLS